MLFYRASTDGTLTDATGALENSYAGTEPTACWLLGSGPSLASMRTELVAASPAPKIGVNFSGRGPDGRPPLLTPDIWTSFDPVCRFHKSIFLNPKITKFLRANTIKDLIPGTTFKTCDCPQTYFFKREHRGFHNFLSPTSDSILDTLDSFIQAIDIGFRLGFRTFYCVGTDLIIRPSEAQVDLARSKGVDYSQDSVLVTKEQDKKQHYWSDRLSDFIDECHRKWGGADRAAVISQLQAVHRETQYNFSETKPLQAAINCDGHYWERVQYLRLARRNIALNGVKIVSCTPGSRLNAWFPYCSINTAFLEMTQRCGDPISETTKGRYSGDIGDVDQHRASLPCHRDVNPYEWKAGREEGKKPLPVPGPKDEPVAAVAAPPAPQEFDIPAQPAAAAVAANDHAPVQRPPDRMAEMFERFKGLAAAASLVPVQEVH